jgi:hypothetical protein
MKPKRSSLPPAPVPNSSAHAVVAARAEALWREQGCPHGRDLEHWLEAERQLGRPLPTPKGDDLEKRSADFSPDEGDSMKNDVDKALDQMGSIRGQRSATSL